MKYIPKIVSVILGIAVASFTMVTGFASDKIESDDATNKISIETDNLKLVEEKVIMVSESELIVERMYELEDSIMTRSSESTKKLQLLVNTRQERGHRGRGTNGQQQRLYPSQQNFPVMKANELFHA